LRQHYTQTTDALSSGWALVTAVLDKNPSLPRWKTIKAELQKETETIFYRSGDVLLIDSVGKFDSELELTSSTGQLKIKYVPERNAVRWETEKEYGFERISSATASLVESLIRRIHKP